MLHWCFNPLMTIDSQERCRSRSDNNMASDQGLHDLQRLMAMLGDTLYEWCDERICCMKCWNNMSVVRTVQSDRHPCSFGIYLVLEQYTGQYQTNDFCCWFILQLRWCKKKKKILMTSDNANGANSDRIQYGAPDRVCTVCSLHFLTKVRDAIYEICSERICLN